MKQPSFILLLCLGALACSAPNPPSNPPSNSDQVGKPVGRSLFLTATPCEDTCVAVVFSSGGEAGPRMAEIVLDKDTGLRLQSYDVGEAASAADKKVVVQDQGESLRVLVFASDNANTIGTGDLANLRFTKEPAGSYELSITADKPFFAPSAAMKGVQLGDPIQL